MKILASTKDTILAKHDGRTFFFSKQKVADLGFKGQIGCYTDDRQNVQQVHTGSVYHSILMQALTEADLDHIVIKEDD